MDIILGLDVGTTEVKAMTWDKNYQCHSTASRKVHLVTPQTGWVEQDAKELWVAVIDVCSQAVRETQANNHQILALSLSTQGGTTIPVDRMNEPTHFAFSWMDERFTKEASDVMDHYGSEEIYQTTGWPLTAGLPINQIAWFRQNRPDAFQRTDRFLFVNDYIVYQLGHALAMDPSNAGITQLFNIAQADWDETLIRIAGIRKDQLSPIFPSGALVAHITPAAACLTGLAPGTPIYNGAHDQYCAAVGAGVVEPGDVLLSCGTAWVLLFVLDRPNQGFERGLAVSLHPIDGVFGGILDNGGVGSTMEWLIDHLWDEKTDHDSRFALLEQAVMHSTPGANGLVFVPLSGGYHRPDELLNRGPIGLSLIHSRADIARAAMEGIAFELDLMLANVVGKIPIHRLIMIGGASRNPHWPQMIADITGVPIGVPLVKGAASLGAAILAGKSLGWYSEENPAISNHQKDRKEFLPDRDVQQTYRQVKARYRQLRRTSPLTSP